MFLLKLLLVDNYQIVLVVGSEISGIDPDVPGSTYVRSQAAVDRLYVKREKKWNEAHQQISKVTRKKR